MERTIALTEINATLHRYASTARNGDDWDLKAAEFSPDARILLPNGISLPPDRMKEIMGGGEAKYYRHHITAIDVRFVSEREAKATCQVFVISDMSTCDHWGEVSQLWLRSQKSKDSSVCALR